MHEAAAHADYGRMLNLLRSEADPHACFSSVSTLHTAAHLGTRYVFNPCFPFTEEIRYNNLLTTITLLLEYGADPGMQSHDEMDKKLQSTPCVTSVRNDGDILNLLMLDGTILKIESRNIADLDAAEYEMLFQYFNAQKSLHIESGISKRDYFDALMRIH